MGLFRVWGSRVHSGCGVEGFIKGAGFRGLFRVRSFGVRTEKASFSRSPDAYPCVKHQNLGLGFYGLGFRVQGSGLRVSAFRVTERSQPSRAW
jgi:hypothetical protein